MTSARVGKKLFPTRFYMILCKKIDVFTKKELKKLVFVKNIEKIRGVTFIGSILQLSKVNRISFRSIVAEMEDLL